MNEKCKSCDHYVVNSLKGSTVKCAFYDPPRRVDLTVATREVGCPLGSYSPPPRPTKMASDCSGCGGAKYDPQKFNRPGGADELIQGLG